MKTLITVAAVALMAAGSAHAQTATPQPRVQQQQQQAPAFKAKKLTRADLDTLLANPATVLILDVRRPDELQSIGGFPVYLSIQAAELEQRLTLIPKDRTIVTVSNHAARAGRAADLLTSRGFTVAGAIGAQDYEAEGGTLVKIAPPQPRQAASGQ